MAARLVVALLVLPIMNVYAGGVQLDWKTINYGLENATTLNKLIVLDVYTDWCGWCKRMDRDTYADSTVVSYLNQRFIACKMNPEKSGKLTFNGKEYSLGEFGQVLGVRGYPATVFFSEKGELLTVVSGYMAPKDFLPVLKYFGDGVYAKGVSYEDYIKNGSTGK